MLSGLASNGHYPQTGPTMGLELSNETLWLVLLAVNFLSIILLYVFFGKTGIYVWVPIAAIIANIQVIKTIELFGITATLGNIVYAGSFLATDILSENHGKKDASRAVAFGFVGIVAVTLFMNLALLFEPAPSDFAHGSLSEIFTLLPRITAASLAAYLVSQLHDIWAYALWKRKYPSKRLIWLRNNLSTLVSQLIDSVVFTLAAFWGVFSGTVLIEIVITTYVLKVLVAVADTPFVYLAALLHRRREKAATKRESTENGATEAESTSERGISTAEEYPEGGTPDGNPGGGADGGADANPGRNPGEEFPEE